MSEDMPARMSEDMSDRMSEDMPDRMPEDMPERMSEDMFLLCVCGSVIAAMPVLKCCQQVVLKCHGGDHSK